MWLFTRYGFYSIGCARKPDGALDPQTVMVRARCEQHLRKLQERFPALAATKIIEIPNRDYRYRLIMPKSEWAGIVQELAIEQEWSNFKDEAASYQGFNGYDYIDALHDVWNRMSKLQGRAQPPRRR